MTYNSTAQEVPALVSPEDRATIRILVVDDEETFRSSCASLLSAQGYQTEVCAKGEDAIDLIRRKRFDIMLVDLFLRHMSGLKVIQAALEVAPEVIAVIMTGNPTIESSVTALQEGAWDYLPKPFSATQLEVLIGRAAHAVMVGREQSDPTPPMEASATRDHNSPQLIGDSKSFTEVLALAHKVAGTDASVFLIGESGTGKEVIAQYIHAHSRRRTRELVPVNSAAIPETLLESEMFGHVEGAFTGATKVKKGLLEVSNGGTMFLDELTEMPTVIQAKLLRVIQDGVLRRLGSTKIDAVVDVRFIAATNRDPHQAVQEGLLRRDLYYRLRVVPIRLAPLRERPEDIPSLANHFLEEFWITHRATSRGLPSLSDAAMAALMAHPWRGNIRELRNVLEHAVVLADPDAELQPDQIPFLNDELSLGGDGEALDFNFHRGGGLEEYHQARDRILGEFEHAYLRSVVRSSRGNMSEAAKLAGVDRTTLYRLMQKHDTNQHELMSFMPS
jgi:DNA-binding NtrC family response regulator